ncbi:2-keto-4-pentenoate hydratase/2-oxohepta-3-ene-1,7-dioic acid hydratase in catechol pathway [Leucobacter luti]|uniref:2-keto-4-pentenoate hydratase/2-oxohepta-3-ene-1,7-dioic acid hydratase in catechol pathway n=1 Tax=Leucobacter luti TaxID=340320 RepID=A0A4R6S8Q9_9MICO|nr:fumarylacetoacetate hydrolase family protein [Leucobacter luti]MCW2288683.1 2-keto-4-pentenoate hydratase/2-oxohepta-3-ene-1,7-dioic acid hydratase in catechol pathway [Leucobacter luti]TCK45162.1 2-keto-4-pentenoate hydratase/2-oxohepta-3-ene-1,7-dioic acid hydratase in catechol pathway [Leucobacter luti]TDP95687.1 2-keto-4-pentenoate hydratase/2-oxohepta-3-ene-1,7-dioic acid hydratase in catechol pathway [Leucobacter luti]
MHLGTIRTGDGDTRAAVREDSDWILLDAADVGALITDPQWRDRAKTALANPATARVPERDAVLAAPIQRPAKIVCCGLNYHDHIVETGRDIPEYPTLFAKFADTLTDPAADIVIDGSAQVDWEAELVVVMGAPLRRGTREEAETAILGYTVANDISCRDWQARTLQWFQGKAWDGTTPIGPVVVTADTISPSTGLDITCEIDGEVVQRSTTRELVFDAATLAAYVSQFTELSPGDLILTGTPGGVGLGANPPRWLADGQVLTTTIEGIGTLQNTMRITAPDDQGSPA